MDREELTLEALAIAMAARNSGGVLIAQVERLAEHGSLHPRQVKMPGVLVNAVVVAQHPAHHEQTFGGGIGIGIGIPEGVATWRPKRRSSIC